MHILITGQVGVGKTTLIDSILRQVRAPVYGFRTKKAGTGPSGEAPVYIHPATGEMVQRADHIVGISSPKGATAYAEVFDGAGLKLLTDIPAGSVVLMDELGFMESGAPAFTEAALRILDGPYHVLAAVKPANTPFLTRVRAHTGALLYTITVENRDDLRERILADLRGNDPDSPFLPL